MCRADVAAQLMARSRGAMHFCAARGRDDTWQPRREDSSDDEITFASNSKSQISPSLSVSSNSSRKGKVGITIKKSPVSTGGERGTKFETSLLGGSSSEDEEDDDSSSEDDGGGGVEDNNDG